MKRRHNLITLSALLLAVGACTDGPVLVDTEYEDIVPSRDKATAITFATFADRITRAVPTVADLEFYHTTFKVYATKTSNGGSKIQPIFEGDMVTAYVDADSAVENSWRYDIDRYWDKQADNYQFVAFAPAHAPLGYQHNLVEVNHATASFFSPAAYALIGQNLQEAAPDSTEKNTGFTGEAGKDCDVMRSDAFPVTDPASTPVVSLNFRHTLAKLMVTVKANAGSPYLIEVDSLRIDDLYSTGRYDHSKGWVVSDSTALVDYRYTTPSTPLSASRKTYFVESLVMPQDTAATQVITLDYTIVSGTYREQFTYVTTLADVFNGKAAAFNGGNSYTVHFNIAPEKNIITFEAGVTTWVDNEANINIE